MSLTGISRTDGTDTLNSVEHVVIHPLDDVPEKKVDISKLGRMQMKPSVRLSLLAMRIYLLLMAMLVIYHVMDLAGAFGARTP